MRAQEPRAAATLRVLAVQLALVAAAVVLLVLTIRQPRSGAVAGILTVTGVLGVVLLVVGAWAVGRIRD